MSNRRNPRRGGARRYEKGRKPKKVSAKAASAITAQIVAERKRRTENEGWARWLKSPDAARWRRHGKWKRAGKGSKGLKKKRIRARNKMLAAQYKALSTEGVTK